MVICLSAHRVYTTAQITDCLQEKKKMLLPSFYRNSFEKSLLNVSLNFLTLHLQYSCHTPRASQPQKKRWNRLRQKPDLSVSMFIMLSHALSTLSLFPLSWFPSPVSHIPPAASSLSGCKNHICFVYRSIHCHFLWVWMWQVTNTSRLTTFQGSFRAQEDLGAEVLLFGVVLIHDWSKYLHTWILTS